jgi:hypothetical protein
MKKWCVCSVADPDPGSGAFYPLDLVRIRDEFFPDLGYRIRPLFFWRKFLTLSSESLLCYLCETGLPLKLSPETISSKKKVCLVLLPPFTYR